VLRVKYHLVVVAVVAAVLGVVTVISLRHGAPTASKAPAVASKAPAPINSQFIYAVQADLPGPVKRIETWTSVDGSRTGSERWTKCSMEGSTIPQCLIMLPKGRGPDALDDRTYTGIQQKLPADPGQLAAYLQTHNSCNADRGQMLAPNQAAFSEIAMITDAIQVLPPGYGQLLFQAATKIPGTNVLARVTDLAGGSGTAVSMVESTAKINKPGRNWGLFELIFTPGTYQYLGLQFFTGPAAHGPWTLAGASSLLSYKFVRTAPHDYIGGASSGTTVCISP
jgi:hypothetical protein